MNIDFVMGLIVGAVLVAVIVGAWRELDKFYDSQERWPKR
jgi:hypothetical protein